MKLDSTKYKRQKPIVEGKIWNKIAKCDEISNEMCTKYILFFLLVLNSFACYSKTKNLKLITPVVHTSAVKFATYSHNGKLILTCGADGTVALWDCATHILLAKMQHLHDINYAEFSPDDKHVIVAGYDTCAYVWDVKTSNLTGKLTSHKDWVYYARYSPDGEHIVTSDAKGIIKYWDAKELKLINTQKLHKALITSLIFTKVPNQLITASVDSSIVCVDLPSGRKVWTKKHNSIIRHAEINNDKTMLITSGANGTVKVWDCKSGELMRNLIHSYGEINNCHFSPDSRYILTSTSNEQIAIWSVKTGENLINLNNDAPIIDANFDWTGDYIYLIDGEMKFKKINFLLNTIDYTISGFGSDIWCYRVSKNMKELVLTSGDGKVNLYEESSGKLITELKGNTPNLYEIHNLDNENRIIGVYSDNSMRIWDMKTGQLSAVLIGHEGYPCIFSYNKRLNLLATSDHSGTSKIWDCITGILIKTIDSILIKYFFYCGKFQKDQLIAYHPLSNVRLLTYPTLELQRTYIKVGRAIMDCELITDQYLLVISTNDTCYFPNDCRKIYTLYDYYSSKLVQSTTDYSSLPQLVKKHIARNKVADSSLPWDIDKNFIKIKNIDTHKEICSFTAIDSNDYLTQIPTGYYQCTPAAARLLHYATPDLKTITFEQLDVKYNRPDKVLEAIGCPNTQLIASYRKAYQKRIKKLGIDTTSFSDDYTVPEADFENRDKIAYEHKDGYVRLHIRGTDNTYKLDRFNVWINENPLFGIRGLNLRSRNTNTFDTTITISLSNDKNTIETSVFNVNGIESYRKPLFVNHSPAKQVLEQVWFIGIGIDSFSESGHNLQWSAEDIRNLSSAFKKKYGSIYHERILLNSNVTTINVIALKQWLQNNTSINDKVIVAYSGHGLFSKDFDYFLSTYNTTFSKVEDAGLPYDALESLLDSIPARKKLMLIDACHGGEIDKEEWNNTNKINLRGENAFDLMQQIFVNVQRSTGATVIAAAAGKEDAIATNKLKGGVFTYSILEKLRSPESNVTVSELREYVGKRVFELTGGLQVPTTRSERINLDWEVW